MRVFLFAAALGFTLLSCAEVATAKVLEWELQNVKFDDGEPLTGSFFFDAEAGPGNRLVAWDISVTALDGLPAYRFSPADVAFSIPADSCSSPAGCLVFYSKPFLDIDPIGRVGIQLFLVPNGPLSDAGGKVALSGYETSTYFGPRRDIVTGQLVSIPEPSQTLLLILGFATLAGFRSRYTIRNSSSVQKPDGCRAASRWRACVVADRRRSGVSR